MIKARTLGVVVAAIVLAGCGALPRPVHDDSSKKAITTIGAGNVVADYSTGRAEAMTQSDVGRLQEVAADAALAIDGRQPTAAEWSEPKTVLAGEFDAYPMWFVAVSDIADEDVQVAAVFSRASAAEPWLLVQAPRLAATTELPEAEMSHGAAVVDDGTATMPSGVSADELVERYADKLSDPTSASAAEFADDSFVTQMRAYADAQPDGVGFAQTWDAAEVSHVVKLDGGGALVFADLVRTETYDLEEGKSLRFDGSEASRFFSEPIHDSATLTYYHQLLMLVPPKDKPRTIGQYGALVSATGS